MRKGSRRQLRSARVWLAFGVVSLVFLPWYGRPSETSLTDWLLAAPAFVQGALLGRIWLLALVVPLVACAIGLISDPARPKLLTASAAIGLALLVMEAFAIGGKGWQWPLLAALPVAEPSQPALGWGALCYATALIAFLAYGLAWQGWCKGEVFIVGALSAVIGSILVFVGYPVACILLSAFRDNAGQTDLLLFASKLTDASIWSLACLDGGRNCGVAWNSLALATIVGALTVLLGLAFAFIAERSGFRFKRSLQLISILPIITPPFVIGLALILLFGRAGMITGFLQEWAHIPRSRWIYGFPGLVIAQLLAFTPISYLVLRGVLQSVSPSLEEASQTLRSGRWRTFWMVTWPLIRPGLANAFLIGFIESLADFGNPIMIGGNFRVLSTSVYFAVVGAAQDQGQAAVLAIVLLCFTLAAFVLQRLWVGKRSYVSVTGKGDSGLPAKLPNALLLPCYGLVGLWALLTIGVYGVIMVGGFVKAIGTDNTPTLQYFLTAFRVSYGDHGWFLAGSAWNSLINTLYVALMAMPLTAMLGILTAYLLNRQSFAGKALFEFLTMMSFAIPGTVIGVSYILAFNVPPIELTGTGMIMVIAFVFRNMPVGIRAGLASLAQVDKSLDEASTTLGAGTPATFRRVILPILRPAVATSMVYSFVRAITSVSAVIFLVSGEYSLATVYIVGRAEFGEYGIAIVYSAVLILIMVAALASIQWLVGEQRIGRRRNAPATTLEPAKA